MHTLRPPTDWGSPPEAPPGALCGLLLVAGSRTPMDLGHVHLVGFLRLQGRRFFAPSALVPYLYCLIRRMYLSQFQCRPGSVWQLTPPPAPGHPGPWLWPMMYRRSTGMLNRLDRYAENLTLDFSLCFSPTTSPCS